MTTALFIHTAAGRLTRILRALARTRLGMRNVAVLGVAGGLVPSASALIVLLAAVTTGRLAFGLALIVAFGLGMAVVLAAWQRSRPLPVAGSTNEHSVSVGSWVGRWACCRLDRACWCSRSGRSITYSALSRMN